MNDSNPYFILISIIIFNTGVFLFLSKIKRMATGIIRYPATNSYTQILILLSIIFCVTATYDGDFWHYKEGIEELYSKPSSYSHMEELHIFIVKYMSLGNNLLWRFIIWGGGIFFLNLSYKRICKDDLTLWGAFFAFTLLTFSPGRVSLGAAVMFYGYSFLLIKNKGKLLSICIGCALIAVSLFLHKSLFMLLIPILLSFVKLTRFRMIFFLLLFPCGCLVFTKLLELYLGGNEVERVVMYYLDQETEEAGPGIYIYKLLFILPIVSTLFLSLRLMYKDSRDIPHHVMGITQFCFWIIYMFIIVYVTLTANGIGNGDVSFRIFTRVTLPISIVFAFLTSYKNYGRLCLFIYLTAICAVNYRLLYAFYLQRLGVGI